MEIRTNSIRRKLGLNDTFRFTAGEKALLISIAKTTIASSKQIKEYERIRSKSISKLLENRILKETKIGGLGTVYTFADQKTARAFGSTEYFRHKTSSVRHGLTLTEAYYKLGKPDNFKLVQKRHLSKLAIKDLGKNHIKPDAVMRHSDGSTTFIEADIGSYKKKQIVQKVEGWKENDQNQKIIWVRDTTFAIMPNIENIEIINCTI